MTEKINGADISKLKPASSYNDFFKKHNLPGFTKWTIEAVLNCLASYRQR